MMNTTRNITRKIALMAIAGMALATTSAHAVVTYEQGDLLLGFRKAGVSTDVVINIGQASLYRDATSNFNVSVGNLSSLLSANFGGTWATDSGLLWSVIGAPTTTADFNGDTLGTFYVSREETTAFTQSALYSVNSTNRDLVDPRIQSVQNLFNGLTEAGGNNFAALWDNTVTVGIAEGDWSDAMIGTGRSNLAFGSFAPTQIQGGDPSGISTNGLDLYRLLAGSGGTTGETYEGTFRIDSTGALAFNTAPSVAAVPEPSRMILLGVGLAGLVMRRRRNVAA